MSRIGVQSMMLKDDFARSGILQTLRRVREIGYGVIELSQVAMTDDNVLEIERAQAELGMEVAAISVQLATDAGSLRDSLMNSLDKLIVDAKRLNTREIRFGIMPRKVMHSPELVFEFCDYANEMASKLREHGLRLSYHNHHIEFVKHHGSFLLDLIAERAPLLGIEIDVHWVRRAGLDPVTVLAKYGSRVSIVHLKDYRIGWMPPEDLGTSGQETREKFLESFLGTVQFAEIGEGNLDFSAIVNQSLAVGARYLIVEQDECYNRTALESLKISYDNLVVLGYRDLF
jgi:sugar phosphate isomerase/epimerase